MATRRKRFRPRKPKRGDRSIYAEVIVEVLGKRRNVRQVYESRDARGNLLVAWDEDV